MLAAREKTWRQSTRSVESRASIQGLVTQPHRSREAWSGYNREQENARGRRHEREGKTVHLEKEKKIISRAFLCWKRTHSIFLRSPILPSQSVKDQAKFTFTVFIHRQIKHSAGQERKGKSSTNLFAIIFSNLSSSGNLSCYISPTTDSSPVGPAIKCCESWSV